MVVTSGIEWAIQYFQAFRNYLAERKSLYLAIVAFSGVHDEALGKEMQLILKDDTQFYKLFVENDSFRGEWREMIPLIFRAMP